MVVETKENRYAHFLKELGNYVVTVDGTDWCDYQGFMVPAYLPHSIPEISRAVAREVLRISGRPFVRWDREFGKAQDSQWWYILKRGPWDIKNIKNKKKRWMVRQGEKHYTVRPLTSDEVVNECPEVARLATLRYKGKAKPESQELLQQRVNAMNNVPGVFEYIGCFHGGILISYAESFIQNNAVWMYNIRHVPAFMKKYSGYALMNGILNYYLNTKKMDFVLDGSRSIHHKTHIQEHLMSVFGFSRQYASLNVEYSAYFKTAIKAAFPLKKIVWSIYDKHSFGFLDNMSAVLMQEEIRNNCQKQNF